MATSVIVIGGGVAGLTVAHELVERGFKVDVYESRPTWGGKARSQPVVGSGTGGRLDLPGEHGFRFYPRFYKHVIDTMQRIPSGSGSVVDHLKPTTESAIALVDDDTWFRFFRKKVTKPYDILEALELFFEQLDFDDGDITLFAAKILQFFATCDERRVGEYEHMSWWDFLDADKFSPKFQRQLRAVPRTMVAMDPKYGSAFTVGTISMQLILDYADSGVNNDRTMGGPTSEMWFDPWFLHLTAKGVGLHAGKSITEIQMSPTQISGVKLDDGTVATADFYVLAVPIDKVVTMITPQMGAADPVLENLRTKNPDDLVSWMVGIQYFLYEDVPLVRGHTFYPDSPWALTSISQPQFWRDLGLFRKRYGDGEVGGLISVDVSDWNTPGTYIPKIAKECTVDEIKSEIWQQMKAALNGTNPEDKVLTDELLHSSHLDDDLDFSGATTVNHSRLLIHPPGSWALRPDPGTAIANLVLAGDYIKTNTNLASMEGANEAARKAVNVILQRSGSTAGPCQTWPLTEPERFDTWKALDAQLYAHGKGHLFELMGIKRAAEAADLLRRFTAFTGLSKIDDLLDKVRATSIIKGILTRLGIP
ncbi:MAG: FAD-dependent oxidoreductase [Kofleriaceae bacterium]